MQLNLNANRNIDFSHGRNIYLHYGGAMLNIEETNAPESRINRVGGYPNVEKLTREKVPLPLPPTLSNIKRVHHHHHHHEQERKTVLNSVKIPNKKLNNLKFEL